MKKYLGHFVCILAVCLLWGPIIGTVVAQQSDPVVNWPNRDALLVKGDNDFPVVLEAFEAELARLPETTRANSVDRIWQACFGKTSTDKDADLVDLQEKASKYLGHPVTVIRDDDGNIIIMYSTQEN